MNARDFYREVNPSLLHELKKMQFVDNETRNRVFRKVGRNDPCPCGSGIKFKKCCLNKPTQEDAT